MRIFGEWVAIALVSLGPSAGGEVLQLHEAFAEHEADRDASGARLLRLTPHVTRITLNVSSGARSRWVQRGAPG